MAFMQSNLPENRDAMSARRSDDAFAKLDDAGHDAE
jgi:hypothetical protein